jgi:putative membrane protein
MPIHRLLLSTAAAIALTLSVPALAQQPMSSSSRNTAMPQQQQQLSKQDMEFMKNAAIGGMTEVELGKLAQQNGQTQQVKDFGARMVQDHGKANDELKSIAQQKGVQLPDQLDREHQAMRDRLAKLQGDAFDRAYMRMMTTDHDKDLKEFRKEAQASKDPDLKRFARDTLNVIEQHDQLAHNVDRQLTSTGSSRAPR